MDADPATARLERLVAALYEQLAARLAGRDHTVAVVRELTGEDGVGQGVTVQKAVRAWYFEQDAGYYVQCRYGTRVLMLHGKSNAVFVEKLGQVSEVFAVFRAAALTGEVDRAVLLVMRARGKQGE